MYYQNQRYSYSYNYLYYLEQDLKTMVFKLMLKEAIISSVSTYDKREVESICDGIFGLLDIVNPPLTQECRILTSGTNVYNLLKYNR